MVETNSTFDSENQKSAPKKNSCKNETNQQGPKGTKRQNTARVAHVAEPRQRKYPVPLPVNKKQEPGKSIQTSKRPRVGQMIMSDDFKRQQIALNQRYDQWKDETQKIKARIQQQNQARGVHCLNPSPDFDRYHYPQQQLGRDQLTPQQQPIHQLSYSQPRVEGIYNFRMKEYIHYLRMGIKDNSMDYWRNFVSTCYAKCAKERWCVSSYENIEQPLHGASSFPAMDAWCCDLCGANSGKGFEASYEILPRLLQMRFASGELDQNLLLESPGHHQLKSGGMLLEYGKVVLETTYQQGHVSREGKLRVIFRQDLKILSWQFCVWRHEEFLSRHLVAQKANQFIDASNQYQSSIYNYAYGNVSEQQLQADGNMYEKSGQELASFVELPLISDLGFSAKHGRCLEVAQVANSMKDLMGFSSDKNSGPIESLQTYPRGGNNTNMWVNMETEAQQTAGQRSATYVQGNEVRPGAMHFVSENNINNGTFPNNNGMVVNGSGHDRSRLPVCHQGFQRENPSNTMQSTSTSKYDPSDQNRAPPYAVMHFGNNPGSVKNSSVVNGLSSLPVSPTSKIVQQHIKTTLFDQAMAAEDSIRRNGVAQPKRARSPDPFMQGMNGAHPPDSGS